MNQTFNNPVQEVRAYGKGVNGCRKAERDVMLSFRIEEHPEIHDIFLTQSQAESLLVELSDRIKENKEDGN